MTDYDFKGQTVLITGAARGLGKRAAEKFGEAGANLVLNDYDACLLYTSDAADD